MVESLLEVDLRRLTEGVTNHHDSLAANGFRLFPFHIPESQGVELNAYILTINDVVELSIWLLAPAKNRMVAPVWIGVYVDPCQPDQQLEEGNSYEERSGK